MSLDFVSVADTTYLTDNFLPSEDWDNDLGKLDILADSISGSEHFLSDGSNFRNPLGELVDPRVADWFADELGDPWDHLNSGNPDIIENLGIKAEPLSPLSTCSEDSADSGNHSISSPTSTSQLDLLKIETPPLSPPVDNNTPQLVPAVNGINVVNEVIVGQNQVRPKNGKRILPRPQTIRQVIIPKTDPSIVNTSKANTIKITPVSVVGPKLVLAPSNGAPLSTSSTVACTQPPPAKQARLSNNTNVKMPVVNPVASEKFPTCPPDVDIRLWKRQQRMIKNRESACLSRKKKKEYLTNLEVQIQDIQDENEQLKLENKSLKKQLEVLRQDYDALSRMQSILPSTTKTATCLLAVVFIIGFNVAPLSVFNKGATVPEYVKTVYSGRNLLSFNENNVSIYNISSSSSNGEENIIKFISRNQVMFTDKERNQLMVLNDMSDYPISKAHPSCPFNSTEVLRLADKLKGWVFGHEQEKKKSAKKSKRTKSLKRRKRDMARKMTSQMENTDERGLQLYDNLFDRRYANLLDALDRKNDTFYVVSFRRDHLLLPALQHNNTGRPKISVLMPALRVNDSTVGSHNADYMSMMQIDCEVMDTHVIQVRNAAAPSTVKDHFTVENEPLKFHPRNITIP
ncbi:cyclic AMP-dependent transcription factor ATF-6 alpha-like [Anneissia japonica]|uniref:cyclic AMP-dependent transcription factor ATF-6 alpha-like n=1 Tax=Anneissia japonica TaxID=1529436 RepID=UPI001425A8C5|nr:cyclic AMP-dependent transcription factor ATF-6 alpha-like [Anneissia japonica]